MRAGPAHVPEKWKPVFRKEHAPIKKEARAHLNCIQLVCALAALLAIAQVWAATPAGAQGDVAAFYRGKQLRMIVGSAVGGGYDLFARIVARHIVHHIPGNPTIIVQNQPSAGG